ncbi:MAG: amidohydrolase family protein, partial [Deltaproteobacteria bacterium]|nr:amidohydrolase family protein [Deltaproteobacteria bacterium]
MDGIIEGIGSAIEAISLVDTHEHTMLESERNDYAVDFSYLFGHYNSSDLVSAGMSPSLMEAVRLPMHHYRLQFVKRLNLRRYVPEPQREDMSLEQRWKALEPFWEAIRNTAYAKATLIAAKDLFGVDDFNTDTYVELSSAIAESRTNNWYRYVMKEKARIEIAILDLQTTEVDRSLFAPVVRLDDFIDVRSRQDLSFLEKKSQKAIHSLDHLAEAMRIVMERYAEEGAVGIKTALAYIRTLQYDKVSHHEAELAFNKIARHLGEGPSFFEAKPLQDYMMHQVIRCAIDRDLPLQIHTGLQEGNENIITNSNPTDLINLFVEYREARFDLFHGGYPFVHQWATLAKNFANVYADLCWVNLISPEMGRRLLHELIETVPGNKIMAFGGDSITVEIAYAHAKMTRQVVSRVLSDKVSEGYMSEDEAVRLARKILRDNP